METSHSTVLKSWPVEHHWKPVVEAVRCGPHKVISGGYDEHPEPRSLPISEQHPTERVNVGGLGYRGMDIDIPVEPPPWYKRKDVRVFTVLGLLATLPVVLLCWVLAQN